MSNKNKEHLLQNIAEELQDISKQISRLSIEVDNLRNARSYQTRARARGSPQRENTNREGRRDSFGPTRPRTYQENTTARAETSQA